MKVTGIRAIPFAYERTRAIGDANLPPGNRWMTCVAVLVDTDEGLVGSSVGYAGCEHAVARLAEGIVGEDPSLIRGLWERMAGMLFKHGTNGTDGQAMSAIDIALWDLKAKERSEPLWRTLGASQEPVSAYASGIDMPLSDEDLRAYYEGMARLGFTAGKLKVGLDPDADLRRLGIMCEALRSGTGRATLMVDANEVWSAKQAIRRVSEMEERFDIAWVEEPVDRLDVRGLRQVADGIRAAVATGENLHDLQGFVSLVSAGAVDVVQPNVLCGGFTGALKVAELANAHNLPIAMMNSHGHVLAHVGALFPTHWMLEVVDPEDAAVVQSSVRVADGKIHLNDDPGHGMWIDEEQLEHHSRLVLRAQAESIPYVRNPSARRLETGQQHRGC